MNHISISLLFNNQYKLKTFVTYDGKEWKDYLNEVSEKTFLENIVSENKIVVNDLKYFIKYLNSRNVDIFKHLHNIDSFKIYQNLLNVDNKNIKLSDYSNNYRYKLYEEKIKIFKKLYKEKYIDLSPEYILKYFSYEEALELYNIKIVETEYYKEFKKWIASLAICEQNGIKVKENSEIDNIKNFIYPDYYYDRISTGRLYNEYPVSFQNLPIESEIRKDFISRFDKGKLLIADWNSIDLRVAFALAGEMISSNDLHTDIAKIVFEKDDISEDDRKIIKEINFSLLYGASIDNISKKINLSRLDTLNIVKKLFDKFEKLKNFIHNNNEFVKRNGFVESYFGRKRFLKQNEYTKFLNSKVQMTSSDICLRAIHGIETETRGRTQVKLIPYIVYDKLAIDCHTDWVEDGKKLFKKVMAYYAPWKLSSYVNFPISIEIRDTL